jgi:hypothetical protein
MIKRAFFLTGMALISGAFVYLAFFSRSALSEVDELIRNELPQGSSKQQVYDFLESGAIRSGAYNAGLDPFDGLAADNRQWRRYVVARINKKSYLPFKPNYTIYVYFYFDLNQNLDDFKLQKIDQTENS